MKTKDKRIIIKVLLILVAILIIYFEGMRLDFNNSEKSNKEGIEVINENDDSDEENVKNIQDTDISNNYEEEKENESINQNKIEGQDVLRIYYFNVGQADSTLIINSGKTMLIDGGNDADGKLITEYIKELGVSQIDVLIATHAHEDHIGGLDKIVDELEIGEIYMPYTTSTSKQVEELLDAIESKNLYITEINIGDKFDVGSAKCEVIFVDHDEPSNINNSSIIIQMKYGDHTYLFMGDAEKQVENKIDWSKVDVLKVPHHGSNTSSTQKFLNATSPDIAVIQVGRNNIYNLPNENALKRIEGTNAKIYRTDLDGTILLISDGKGIEVKTLDICLDGNK